MSAYNGAGTFVISGVGLPFVTGTTISSSVANQLNTDLATGLSTCITKDGQTTPTANIPMGGFRLTGVGAPTAANDGAVLGVNFFDSSVSNPSGTTSTASIKMMGLGSTWTVTPGVTGRLRVFVTGDANNSGANNGAIVQVRYGTGAAPANGAAQAGTQAGRNIQVESAINAQNIGFSIPAQLTGLAVSTALWFDIGLSAETAGTANVLNLSILIVEY